MATSAVQICSNALLMLGAQTINSFGESTDRAILCSNIWENARDAVLRAHPWNCAIERVALAPLSAAPAFEWTYQFQLPGDCLRLLSIGEEGDTFPYRLEQRKILCDENPLYVTYLKRVTDVTQYDASLVAALEAYMASLLAYPITKDRGVVKDMTDLYAFKMKQAKGIDGQETPPEQFGDFPFINARG
jgi:hypothetical protein